MNDIEYYNHYKHAFEVVFSTQTSDLVFLKDADFRIQSINLNMLKFLGLESDKEILNLTSQEVAIKLNLENLEIATQFNSQDLQIQSTKRPGTFLEVMAGNKQPKICIIYKTPVINPQSGSFCGIRGQVFNLIWPHAVKTLLKMHGSKGLILGQKNAEDAWKQFPLNKMQHMVLFLCLNNYSYSEISILLNEFGYDITPIRVNDYLEQLKFIFHVRNKTQLIEKAIGLNFHIYLPDGLFNKIGSVEISHEAAEIVCFDCQSETCGLHQA